MEQQLAIKTLDIDSLQKLSKELFTSSLFDSKNPSQIFAKILAGKELGLEPIASITGINMIQGKPCLGANLIATLIARHPSYKYKVLKSTKEICEIEIFENKVSLGTCDFTMTEANLAGLSGKDVWKKYPSDMLFARCITRAARRFAPGIFGGTPIYTAEELNVDMDEEGRIIEGEIEKTIKETKPEDYRLQSEKEIIEIAAPEQTAIIVDLSEKLQKGIDYVKKVVKIKFGHEDLTKIPKKFADEWQANLKKRFDETQKFVKEMDGEAE